MNGVWEGLPDDYSELAEALAVVAEERLRRIGPYRIMSDPCPLCDLNRHGDELPEAVRMGFMDGFFGPPIQHGSDPAAIELGVQFAEKYLGC